VTAVVEERQAAFRRSVDDPERAAATVSPALSLEVAPGSAQLPPALSTTIEKIKITTRKSVAEPVVLQVAKTMMMTIDDDNVITTAIIKDDGEHLLTMDTTGHRFSR
jgi:hypothetical protein